MHQHAGHSTCSQVWDESTWKRRRRWDGVSKVSVSMVCSVFFGCFSEVLLRCEQLPFASQVVRLNLLQHGANMSQTQCD